MSKYRDRQTRRNVGFGIIAIIIGVGLLNIIDYSTGRISVAGVEGVALFTLLSVFFVYVSYFGVGRRLSSWSRTAKFRCDVCGAEFGSDENLAEHYKSHVTGDDNVDS